MQNGKAKSLESVLLRDYSWPANLSRKTGSETMADVHFAAEAGDVKAVVAGCKKAGTTEILDIAGNTPLVHALWCGQYAVIEVLMKMGADAHGVNFHDQPFMNAATEPPLRKLVEDLEKGRAADAPPPGEYGGFSGFFTKIFRKGVRHEI